MYNTDKIEDTECDDMSHRLTSNSAERLSTTSQCHNTCTHSTMKCVHVNVSQTIYEYMTTADPWRSYYTDITTLGNII